MTKKIEKDKGAPDLAIAPVEDETMIELLELKKAIQDAPPPTFVTIAFDQTTGKVDFRSNAMGKDQINNMIDVTEQILKTMRDALMQATENQVRAELQALMEKEKELQVEKEELINETQR